MGGVTAPVVSAAAGRVRDLHGNRRWTTGGAAMTSPNESAGRETDADYDPDSDPEMLESVRRAHQQNQAEGADDPAETGEQ
jgi:hypothetical protein